MVFRSEILSIMRKSNEKQSDVFYKREENIKSDMKNWMTTTIEEFRCLERERFWIVFEEIRRYRQQSLIYFDISV